jgi:hypothetical protein
MILTSGAQIYFSLHDKMTYNQASRDDVVKLRPQWILKRSLVNFHLATTEDAPPQTQTAYRSPRNLCGNMNTFPSCYRLWVESQKRQDVHVAFIISLAHRIKKREQELQRCLFVFQYSARVCVCARCNWFCLVPSHVVQ